MMLRMCWAIFAKVLLLTSALAQQGTDLAIKKCCNGPVKPAIKFIKDYGVIEFNQLKSIRTPCPRVDVIAISKELSAINLDGFTLGHARNLQIMTPSGDLPIRDGSISFSVAPREGAPPGECTKPNLDIALESADGALKIDGEVLAKFDRFVWTRENLKLLRKPNETLGGGRISVTEGRFGATAAVSSGPSRPQPDAGGGGGGGNASPTAPGDIPVNGPKCCRN